MLTATWMVEQICPTAVRIVRHGRDVSGAGRHPRCRGSDRQVQRSVAGVEYVDGLRVRRRRPRPARCGPIVAELSRKTGAACKTELEKRRKPME